MRQKSDSSRDTGMTAAILGFASFTAITGARLGQQDSESNFGRSGTVLWTNDRSNVHHRKFQLDTVTYSFIIMCNCNDCW